VARKDHHVSLVGYTNAGKSTLMNALTNAGTLTEDRLFATLDTLTRRWDLATGGTCCCRTRWVHSRPAAPPGGVVPRDAEEAIHADLLLHVVDAANPEAEQQVAAVERVLAALEVADKPTLLLLNKADAVRDLAALSILRTQHPRALLVSARSATGWTSCGGGGSADARRATPDRAIGAAHDGKALGFLERFAEVLDRGSRTGGRSWRWRLRRGRWSICTALRRTSGTRSEGFAVRSVIM